MAYCLRLVEPYKGQTMGKFKHTYVDNFQHELSKQGNQWKAEKITNSIKTFSAN